MTTASFLDYNYLQEILSTALLSTAQKTPLHINQPSVRGVKY